MAGGKIDGGDVMFRPSGSWLIAIMAAVASIVSVAAPLPERQKHYSTPDKAVEALVVATRENNQSRLLAILGVDGAELIRSGDPVADRNARMRFVAAYDEAHKIDLGSQDKAVLIVGNDEWPLPIPLIHESSGWRFDTQAGAEEILNRRVGRNELSVIEVCRAYVKGQRDYAELRIGGRSEFAHQFKSTAGQHDGLYWPTKPGDAESPLGPLVAEARAAGYGGHSGAASRATSHPFHGYYFRILTAQGPHAPGGAKSYLTGGQLTQGFALIAYPAKFGDSGINTFIVNQNGIVFEKNLGPETERIVRKMVEYDPDLSWRAP
jgi:hypothetical protein